MDTSNITTTTLRNLLKLTEKRDALRSELKDLEATIAGVAGQKASPAAPAKAARKTRKVRRTRKAGRPAKSTAKPKAATPKAAKVKAVKPAKAKAPRRKKTGRHGALKARILTALHEAGAKGAAVKDLSKQLGVKSQNVHVWFSSTGKKLKEIKKIAPGKYRIKSGS